MKKLTVIDTFAFFFRAYYALPPLKSRDGFPTGLLTGLLNFEFRQVQKFRIQADYFLFWSLIPKESFRRRKFIREVTRAIGGLPFQKDFTLLAV